MKHLFKKGGKWECYAGSTINEAVADAIRAAGEERVVMEFEFNGIPVMAAQYSDPKAVIGKYHRDLQSRERAFEMTKDFQEKIRKAADERIRFINANREKLIEAFIAETGLAPSDCVQCIQTMPDGTVRFWVEKKDSRPPNEPCPECNGKGWLPAVFVPKKESPMDDSKWNCVVDPKGWKE